MIKYDLIFIISIIFIFLSDCRLIIGKQAIFIGGIFVCVSILLLFINKQGFLLKKIKQLYIKTPLKYLILFVTWIFIGIILNVHSFGNIFRCIYRAFLIYGFIVLPISIFTILIIPKYISFNKLFKWFIFLYEFILVYGIFNYIGRIYNITVIQKIHNIICSRAYFYSLRGEQGLLNATTLDRATSIFFEPSWLGFCIFIFLPLIFCLCTSKIKIYKNNFNDKMFKVLLIVLSYINLFLSKTPIYIIVSLIYTIVYFRKIIFKYLLHIVIITSISFSLSNILSYNILSFQNNMSSAGSKVIYRIQKVLEAKDIDSLILKDQSLGTRLCTFINGMIATKEHPIIGVGYENTTTTLYNQFKNSPIPLTFELNVLLPIADNIGIISIFWGTLLQTGIIGILLLYIFFIKTIHISWNIRKYFYGTSRILLTGLALSAINYIINSFYMSMEQDPLMWFIFGILNSYILVYKLNIKKLYFKTNSEV